MQYRWDLLLLREPAEGVALEVQGARDVDGCDLDMCCLQPQGDLCCNGAHRRSAPRHPRNSMKCSSGIHLDQGEGLAAELREPSVDRQHRGVELPLGLPGGMAEDCLESLQVLALPAPG